ncbi:MAG: (Fe-S)-binding protein, partial [Sediminibacterium sp.]|nr:(Fe-S)-binding protein [Sediminibacterium sp.]
QHRVFLPYIGKYYTLFISLFEILAMAVLIACIIFFIRRNILSVKRFKSTDLKGYPTNDANLILITEIILMFLFLIMNSADLILQENNVEHYKNTGNFLVSSQLKFLFAPLPIGTIFIIERTAWWLHIVGILSFLNYLPYSKHLHIILAFPNAYFAKLESGIVFKNMPTVQQEVLYSFKPELAPVENNSIEKFGAKDVHDLSWKSLLDAYSCTECGRCTNACPANITGKILSPRNIMMKTRDRLEQVGKNIQKNTSFLDDNKTLLHDYITEEELWACTTCNACVEECPVSISPLDIIIELRRGLIMEESKAPKEWNNLFSNIENNFSPWKFSPDDRDKWSKE